MTLHELIHRHEFDALVPYLVDIDPENIPTNLYAFKEAFDDLRRMTPSDADGEQIVVSTVVDTDDDGNELDRYIHASHCEGDAWDSCLAKEVIFGTAIGEVKALARILWHMTFWGFTPELEGFRDDTPRNKYERQAAALRRRQFLNYAKGIADPFEHERLCLTAEGWKEYRRRESHRNRAKRMRDARQERSIARLERKGKVQRLIDYLHAAHTKYYSADYFDYLFETDEITLFDFYSRTITVESRAQYIADNISQYFHEDLSIYSNVEMVITFSKNKLKTSVEELRTLCKAIFPLTGLVLDDNGNTVSGYSPDKAIRIHFKTEPSLGHDLHIRLICSR